MTTLWLIFGGWMGLVTSFILLNTWNIMKTVNELTAEVKALTAQSKTTADTIVKIGVETGKTLAQVTTLNQKIIDLEKLIADGANTAELEAAITELATQSTATLAQATATDDLIPDPVPEPPTV